MPGQPLQKDGRGRRWRRYTDGTGLKHGFCQSSVFAHPAQNKV
jgi:hypothetical protein